MTESRSSSILANSIKGLTKKQVEQIFTGVVTDWSAVGGSGGKDPRSIPEYFLAGFYAGVQGVGDEEARLRPDSQKLAGNEQIAPGGEQNPNGLGYVGLAYTQGRWNQGASD